jgi:transposase
LNNDGYYHAQSWYNETITKYIYPKANICSQRISEYLAEIGDENIYSIFLENYIDYLKNINPKFNIMIDSTGLSNSIKIPLTAINNHNGVISNEIRLILVADKISGLPIYYRYVPGNIVDVSTLSMVIREMKNYNVDINRAIMDAGYYSE